MASAFVINQFPTTYGAAMSLLAEMLVSAGWTYKGSGDGLAGYNATGKVFTGTVSGAALSWSNPKAWARLQDPAGGREWLLQHANDATARIKYSASAKFTGGSPSATVTPSATDERLLRGGGTDATPTYGAWFTTNLPLGASLFLGCARDTAPYGFWFGGLETPGGAKQAFLMMDPLEAAAPEDTDQVVIACAHTNACLANSSNLGRSGSGAIWATASGAAVEGCFGHMDAARTAFSLVQPYQWVWCTDNRVVTGGTVAVMLAGANGGFVNPFNNKYEAMPCLYARTQMGSTVNPGLKGWSTFTRWIGLPRVSFSDTFDNRAWVCFGHLWLPWDGTTQPRG